ncbi:MAG: YqgE/AlgH family protein [Planctomycetaceae bacterium]|nr:YqgE/AlgH family protein [Planctomycetaceae bacterium]
MEDSLRGQFLIATPRLRDPNFFKTAVLMIEHGEEGAMGLVVNRPSSMTVAQALTGHLDLPEHDDLVFDGGPVEPNALFIVHNCPNLDPNERPIVPGVYMGSSAKVFEDAVCDGPNGPHQLEFRLYCGCAGWAPGQLEGELSRGDWLVVPGDSDSVFTDQPYRLWDQLLNKSYEANRLLPHICDNPELN